MKLAAALLALVAIQDAPVELFNGKDLTGWVPMNKAEWAVEEGLLTLTGKGGNGWLRSEKQYKDFELSLEWKTTAEKYDSGVYFHAMEKGDPWPRVGIQVNLLKGKEGEGVGLQDAAGKPDLIKAGEWNRFVIRVQGKNAKLSINGKDAWATELPTPREGFVGFQAEGVKFQFRKVSLTPLKSE
jgi:3-keto-disaccharide hydrolase